MGKMKPLEFCDILNEIMALHNAKGRDYDRPNATYANVRAAEEWGIPGWVGGMIRLTDKVRRLQKLAQTGELSNESAVDSFRDIAVYAIICEILYRQHMAMDGAVPHKVSS